MSKRIYVLMIFAFIFIFMLVKNGAGALVKVVEPISSEKPITVSTTEEPPTPTTNNQELSIEKSGTEQSELPQTIPVGQKESKPKAVVLRTASPHESSGAVMEPSSVAKPNPNEQANTDNTGSVQPVLPVETLQPPLLKEEHKTPVIHKTPIPEDHKKLELKENKVPETAVRLWSKRVASKFDGFLDVDHDEDKGDTPTAVLGTGGFRIDTKLPPRLPGSDQGTNPGAPVQEQGRPNSTDGKGSDPVPEGKPKPDGGAGSGDAVFEGKPKPQEGGTGTIEPTPEGQPKAEAGSNIVEPVPEGKPKPDQATGTVEPTPEGQSKAEEGSNIVETVPEGKPKLDEGAKIE